MKTLEVSAQHEPLKMAFFDIGRAHLYVVVDRDLFAELLEELNQKPGQDVVAPQLEKGWYGSKDARRISQGDYRTLSPGT